MEPTIIVINQKENKNIINCTNIKLLIYFVKSCSNSSNKAEKQLFEAKIDIEIEL